MPTKQDWYNTPLYYDIIFDAETTAEADFLEKVHKLHGDGSSGPLNVLEPACGTGRLVLEMARRGHKVTGFDSSRPMLDFAEKRLRKAGKKAQFVEARMEKFSVRRRFHIAHCFVSTFKYLLSEGEARAHLQAVADHLRPGGIYALGFHLTPYRRAAERERWTGSRDGVDVVCNIYSWPPDRATRLEKVRSRLRIKEKGKERTMETTWHFRTYDAGQARALLRGVPDFELVECYDFHYNIENTRKLDDEYEDIVLILKKRGD